MVCAGRAPVLTVYGCGQMRRNKHRLLPDQPLNGRHFHGSRTSWQGGGKKNAQKLAMDVHDAYRGMAEVHINGILVTGKLVDEIMRGACKYKSSQQE